MTWKKLHSSWHSFCSWWFRNPASTHQLRLVVYLTIKTTSGLCISVGDLSYIFGVHSSISDLGTRGKEEGWPKNQVEKLWSYWSSRWFKPSGVFLCSQRALVSTLIYLICEVVSLWQPPPLFKKIPLAAGPYLDPLRKLWFWDSQRPSHLCRGENGRELSGKS